MVFYSKENMELLRRKFVGLEKIETNYSHACQDMFVLMVLNGKRNGFFLEIGANHAVIGGSNSYLLEKEFDWSGISIDITEYSRNSFEEHHRTAFHILSNALEVDYIQTFASKDFPKQIDYLSLDIEPSEQTLACLKKLPLDSYRFSVITYETDFYQLARGRAEAELARKESREIFSSYGYELIVGDLENFEDWYVDPSVVDKDLIEKMKESEEYQKSAIDYIYKN